MTESTPSTIAIKPLSFDYDAERDVMTIEGIRFSGNFFRKFSGEPTPADQWLKIMSNDDGYVMLSLTIGRIVHD